MPRPHRPRGVPPIVHRGGVLVVDKPPAMSSHDVVAVVRRALPGMKVGHTGTLDPFATGVLALVVGQATRMAQFFADADKEYEARIRLGQATDTHDVTGTVTFEAPSGSPMPSIDVVRGMLTESVGPLMQVPPQFSAKMSAGTRAYEHARRGIRVDLPAAAVELKQIEVCGMEEDWLDIRLRCSAGFYVRSLAHDLGERLGIGAHLATLRRIRSGPFCLDQAITLDAVPDQGPELLPRIISIDRLLPEIPAVVLNDTGVAYVTHGRDVGIPQAAEQTGSRVWAGRVRLVGPDGALLAIAEAAPGPVLHPTVVLV